MFLATEDLVENIEGLISLLDFESKKELFFKQIVRSSSPDNDLQPHILKHLEEVIKPSNTLSKKFLYQSSIVSIYGFLESFFEHLAEEYVSKINNLSLPVSSLPSAIRDKHLDLTIQLLTKTRKDESKQEFLKQVIGNLHSFVQESLPHTLNIEAFSAHTANFRYDLIKSYFAQLGVENAPRRALGNKDLVDNLSMRQRQETTDNKLILDSWLTHELQELTQLRNEISHGAFNGQVESFELIAERALFVKSFGLSIAEILTRTLTRLEFDNIERAIIGNPDRAFPNKRSLGYRGSTLQNEARLAIVAGDQVYAFNHSNNDLISGEVTSLFLGGAEANEIKLPNEQDFAIGVNFKVSSNLSKYEVSIAKS